MKLSLFDYSFFSILAIISHFFTLANFSSGKYNFFTSFDFFKNIHSDCPYKWYENITQSTTSLHFDPLLEPSCDYTAPYKTNPDSTQNDLIIGVLMGQYVGLLPFIRTLSTTKTKAQVLIITDDEGMKEIQNTTVNFVLSIINVKSQPHRYKLNGVLTRGILYEFLSSFGHLYKRIIITDISDVVFQEDPFQANTDWDIIHFAFEHYTLQEQYANVIWVRNTREWRVNEDIETEQINAGVIALPGKYSEAFSRMVLYAWGSPNLIEWTNDQGVIELLLQSHYLQDSGLDFITRDRSHIFSYSLEDIEIKYKFPGFMMPQSDDLSSIVHKYYFEESQRFILSHCGLSDPYKSIRDIRIPEYMPKD